MAHSRHVTQHGRLEVDPGASIFAARNHSSPKARSLQHFFVDGKFCVVVAEFHGERVRSTSKFLIFVSQTHDTRKFEKDSVSLFSSPWRNLLTVFLYRAARCSFKDNKREMRIFTYIYWLSMKLFLETEHETTFFIFFTLLVFTIFSI